MAEDAQFEGQYYTQMYHDDVRLVAPCFRADRERVQNCPR